MMRATESPEANRSYMDELDDDSTTHPPNESKSKSNHNATRRRQNPHSHSHESLHSQTYGGYGPIPTNDTEYINGDHKKLQGRKMARRMMGFISNLRRDWGCSADEMLKGEGEDGDYYRDEFNDESWSCSFGTGEENGIWMNASDQSGTIMAFLVWFLLLYSALTIIFLSNEGGIPPYSAMLYTYLCCMALACHAKTTFTDPGSVPQSAVPQETVRHLYLNHAMCSQCQTFKPPMSHHCRICNRCVSRMDHHCPWMNNCVGAANLKHFVLFLLYTWTCAAFSMILLGWSYFFCATDNCHFHFILVELVRVMLLLSLSAFIFTSSMLMNVCYGLMTGIGTIDRLKKKSQNTMSTSEEEPIPLKDVFGIAGYHTWPFPIDPIFQDYDRVMGYSTPQRLLREQMRENQNPKTNQPHAASVVSEDFLPI